ncbi:F0F1 ATP synthase subunit I [Shewanella morhuae]|uniref:F0F1 ATP synthase subunit I n=1 Tax=Shewanella morhuae TaxID=365591 RepID=A0A1N7AF88_9GAMM|nr:ATP synthase subunit I [Shewanella morhuae]PTA48624.1 F0F1 ATP synthase subunit I [Shewanella morhuae]GIU04177.1 ATP synthase subunit I [Shewanella morhuae]SIR37742.1 ATP synthase protein I [Shewanella morhuae]SUI89960.1 F0F1 ATP synthase subunit I [Shewanella morhuae]
MSKVLARRGRWSAYKLVMMQAAVAGGTSILFFAVWGVQFGYSALAGGSIAVLPNFVFATLAFSHTGASSAAKVIKTFYWGEAVKLLLTIAMFSFVFINIKVAFMPLFVCYVLALTVHWTAPLYFKQS